MEVARRRGRRRKKLLDDVKDRRGYCHLKEEALHRTMWRHFWRRLWTCRQTEYWMSECFLDDANFNTDCRMHLSPGVIKNCTLSFLSLISTLETCMCQEFLWCCGWFCDLCNCFVCLLTCTPGVAAVVLVLGPIQSWPDHAVRKAGFYGELLIYFC